METSAWDGPAKPVPPILVRGHVHVSASSRQHFAALDGLRGFAAVSVLLYHIGHWLNAPRLASNAGLAVDFFFCLSGFVLALAYNKRFRSGLGAATFMRVRLIRLMPLIVLATIISALFVCVRATIFKSPVHSGELITATVLGLLNLPFISASSIIGGAQVFPLNGPQYSLFLEIVANLIWSWLRTTHPLRLSLTLSLACLALLWLMAPVGGDEITTFWTGFPRVGASFFAGVAIFHIDRRGDASAVLRDAFWFLVAIMAICFYYPERLPLSVELVWIAVLSPLVVYIGSKVRIEGRMKRLSLLGGELSYPIYALHYPIFCWVNGAYQSVVTCRELAVEGPLVFGCVVVGSYVALRMYDEPVRRWLDRRASE